MGVDRFVLVSINWVGEGGEEGEEIMRCDFIDAFD